MEGEVGVDKEAGLIISFLSTYSPPPSPFSLLASDPSLLPLSLSKPVAISDFLGNLRNNTSERAQDSDAHNKPASVTLNPTHKSLLKIVFPFTFSLPVSLSGKRIETDLY